MHRLLLSLGCITMSLSLSGQKSTAFTPEQLKQFEGIYEYLEGASLQLATSPRDSTLYAIVADGKYPLTPISFDVFLNSTGDTVNFVRNTNGNIRGYVVGGHEYKFLKRAANDVSLWYAREPEKSNRYTYKRALKPKLNDGIDIGSSGVAGLDKRNIEIMISKVVDGTYPDVHSILLFRNNKLVLEEYFYQYERNTLHQLRSATKSIVSALTGIALARSFIKSIDDPVLSYFPEYQVADTSLKKSITIRHLLTNTSGLDCDISNAAAVGDEEEMGNSDDWVKYTLNLPMLDEPGTTARYCSGNVIVLGRILEKASGMKLDKFAEKYLFEPIGIQNYKWRFEPNRAGKADYCQLYMRPRDMGKIGLLYLNNGQWRDKPIVPPGWIRETIATHSTINGVDYGYLWWLQWLEAGGKRYEGFTAKGNGGQRIYVFPEYQFLAVITGGSYNRDSPSDELLINHILPSLEKTR